MKIIHLCNRCASTLQTDARENNWCPVCRVYRPPFRDQGAIVTADSPVNPSLQNTTAAPPLVTPADDNLSTRSEP